MFWFFRCQGTNDDLKLVFFAETIAGFTRKKVTNENVFCSAAFAFGNERIKLQTNEQNFRKTTARVKYIN